VGDSLRLYYEQVLFSFFFYT